METKKILRTKGIGKALVPGLALALLAGCSSTRTATVYSDDIYFVSKDRKSVPAPIAAEPVRTQEYQTQTEPAPSGNNPYNYSGSTQTTDGTGNTYITNNYYYDPDDYYTYSYSARIRRFHHPYGYGFYDPYYTNVYYYDYDPYSWGVSIYLGYNWWWGRSYWNWHNPYYYAYDPWGWNCHYQPWWYRRHGYYHGYNHGYWDGYRDGYYDHAGHPYYYNSYDRTSHRYGPRQSTGTNTRNSLTRSRSLEEVYVSNNKELNINRLESPARTTPVNVNTMPGKEGSGVSGTPTRATNPGVNVNPGVKPAPAPGSDNKPGGGMVPTTPGGRTSPDRNPGGGTVAPAPGNTGKPSGGTVAPAPVRPSNPSVPETDKPVAPSRDNRNNTPAVPPANDRTPSVRPAQAPSPAPQPQVRPERRERSYENRQPADKGSAPAPAPRTYERRESAPSGGGSRSVAPSPAPSRPSGGSSGNNGGHSPSGRPRK